MLIFGPISSLFDFITFFVLYIAFRNLPGAFQTGWFMESLATQTLVIHIIRTRKIPFIQSRASKELIISTVIAVTVAWIIPYLSIGRFFGLTPLPIHIIAILISIVGCYLCVVEFGKRLFYKLSQT